MKKLILEVFMALILSVMGFSTAKADPININKENEAINKQSEPDITAQQINQYNQNVSNTIQINGVTFDSYVHSGKTAVVYVGFAECPHCEKFVSILHKSALKRHISVQSIHLFVRTIPIKTTTLNTSNVIKEIRSFNLLIIFASFLLVRIPGIV